MTLSPDQKLIVQSQQPSALILAGAGSGKTRTVIERINYLLTERNVSPQAILCLTFSHKAATEMVERMVNKEVKAVTFHKLALDLLSTDEPLNLFQEELANFNKADLTAISLFKNKSRWLPPPVYSSYQAFLKEHQLVDFDDLLNLFFAKLKRKEISLNYEYIFIDEFQDTNNLQYLIIKQLIQKKTQVMCVGDPDQSIYAFRGANVGIVTQYLKTFNPKIFFLNRNYRSDCSILDAANRSISHNMNRQKKNLINNTGKLGLVVIKHFRSMDEKCEFIAEQLILRKDKTRSFAVLYRNNRSIFPLHNFLFDQYLNLEPNLYLMTIHQAKGLEFDQVYLFDGNDKIFPGTPHSWKDLEEERRIFFVAVTRAKQELYLLSAESEGKPSRFYRNLV
ncbi:ATP-dependent DNA helicase PcrA [termite gut metagenome]|uniref:DNA 3'-5' helicase n=1 Tax=termite gut metagenome TaxID=433724 RepID=A0A5J4RLB2_9ZZZZ